MTKLRRMFKEWCEENEPIFRQHPRGRNMNYLTATSRPFPNNPSFRSESVLSSEARKMIWEAIMVKGMPLKAVSAEFHVDMRRVAAVVRMMEIEKKAEREVSYLTPLFSFSFPSPWRGWLLVWMMICNKNSISLEDLTVVIMLNA